MVFADPSDAKANWACLVHNLQIVGGALWWGFLRIPQFLLGLMIELIVSAFRLAGLLPQFIGPTDNLFSGRIFHNAVLGISGSILGPRGKAKDGAAQVPFAEYLQSKVSVLEVVPVG